MSLHQAHKAEDEQYAETKAQLRREIGELREKVLSLVATNEVLPDIEKLERQEFILDMEEHQRLQAEEEQLIKQVRRTGRRIGKCVTGTMTTNSYMHGCMCLINSCMVYIHTYGHLGGRWYTCSLE